MPRYYFNAYDHAEHPDFEGAEFPDDDEARSKAVVFMGESLKKMDGNFWPEANGVSGLSMRQAERCVRSSSQALKLGQQGHAVRRLAGSCSPVAPRLSIDGQ